LESFESPAGSKTHNDDFDFVGKGFDSGLLPVKFNIRRTNRRFPHKHWNC
jgi:hypothetical protein